MTASSADSGSSREPETYGVVELEGDETACALAAELAVERGCLGMEETRSGELTRLTAYFPPDVDVGPVVDALARRVPGCRARTGAPLPARDWLAEWKRSLSGFPLGERFYVVPTWLDPPDVSRHVLRIDPEQAFGTGTHETTRLCAELLERYVEAGTSVLDIGTGTGILAMIAALLGASRVHAFESDPSACACARTNVARNGLSDRIEIHCRKLDPPASRAVRATLAVANINSSVLERLIPLLQPRDLVLSGLLSDELRSFRSFLAPRYRVVETQVVGEWAAIAARRV